MCRFSSADCPNYRKVSGELVRIYSQLEALVCGLHTSKFDYTSFVKTVPDAARILRFPGMQNRLKTISNPLDNTCMWLPQVESYANWISRAKLDEHHGLLQVTGKPGSGKSTIMKKTYERVLSSFAGTKTCVAGFFFNKRGTSLEHSSLGMFRSLLYQILQLHPFKLAALMSLYEEDEARVSGLHLSSLQDIFRDVFLDQTNDIRTIIFVDALDECDEPGNRDIAYFFRQLTDSAYNIGVQLDVCLARRDFPTVFLKDCPEIKMERFTRCDIEHYISRQLDIAGFGGSDVGQEIRREIADKANGIFLWVVLVIDEIVKERDNGRNERYLLEQIRHLPAQLDSLFAELLDLHKMSKPELRITLRLFQWAILSTSVLRLREWHHILAFIRDEPPKSLAEWKKSIYYTQTDEQLEKQIRAISRGLVEVKVHPISAALSDGDGAGSVGAGAGSLDSASGDSRIVQPIHESVRAFFLAGGEWLSEALKAAEYPRQDIASFSAEGHIAMMRCCFQYLAIEELQQYYEARLRHTQRSDNKEQDTRPKPKPASPELAYHRVPSLDTASFGSSASSHDRVPVSLPSPDMKKAATFATKSVRSEMTDLGSMSATSQILDEYPALESYAINRTFLHARLAQDGGANPMPIILLLYDGCYWKRWLILQDNVTRTSSLLSLAVEQRLDTWVQYMVGCESLELAEKEMNDALSLAIRRRQAKAISILVAHGAQADLNQRLEEALKNRKTRQAFLVAMEQRQDRDKTNEQALSAVLPGYWKLLYNAIQRGDIPFASDLLNFGVELPLHDITGMRFDEPHFIPSALKLLVDNGADINEQDKCGRTLVHIAVGSGHIDLLKALVAVGADIHAKDDQGLTALHHLAKITQETSSGILEHLISSGADVNAEDICGRTPLHLIPGNNDDGDAKHSGAWSIDSFSDSIFHRWHSFENNVGEIIAMLTELIAAGADINAKSYLGWTSLHYIFDQHGHGELIQGIVRAGADINAKDHAGLTPLHHSVRRARGRCLTKELIANGANIHAEDAKDRTPMDIVFEGYEGRWPHSKTCQNIDALASAGARLDTTRRDTHGWTPLHKAIIADDWTLATLCATHGADINEKDEQGRTALHIACALSTSATLTSDFWGPLTPPTSGNSRRIGLCDNLLELGVDPSAKTMTGLTALHVAADAGIYGPMERMVALGAKLDERDHLGRTPLYFAAAQGYRTVVDVLLKLGANARIRDNLGISPLQRASEGKYATSSATASLLCAHLQGANESWCSCISGTRHVSEN
ncbi:hypothetical protein DL768_010844 [Monosporascus sp. mg162]|nr:hypothetical protein DL768_010844 [Monosporascus sp. mg162]